MKVRKPSASPMPWDEASDDCKFYLLAEGHSERSTPDAINPIDALHEPFRRIAGWTKLSGKSPDRGWNYVLLMRRPEPEFVAGSEFRFVAIDPHTYRGSAGSDPELLQEFWDHQINARPFSMPFLKSGPVIWKKIGIEVPAETTAYMMGLDTIDRATSDAINAAIFSAYNTAASPIDIETVIFTLATFINADPLRKHLHSKETFAEPYGDRTKYALKGFLPHEGGEDEQ